jgi:hypothetical protein
VLTFGGVSCGVTFFGVFLLFFSPISTIPFCFSFSLIFLAPFFLDLFLLVLPFLSNTIFIPSFTPLLLFAFFPIMPRLLPFPLLVFASVCTQT